MLTVATLVVFWLAPEYAHALARQPRGARRLKWPVVAAAMAEERRMLEAPALLLLALGGTGLVDAHLAVRPALWAGVAPARRLGVTYARRQRWGWPTALTAGAVNGTFGLVIVALEVLIDRPAQPARTLAFWAWNSSSVRTPWSRRAARSLSCWIGSAAGAGGGGCAGAS